MRGFHRFGRKVSVHVRNASTGSVREGHRPPRSRSCTRRSSRTPRATAPVRPCVDRKSRAGLSERGLLHYFASRDDLFVSILEERDAADRELIGQDAGLEDLAVVQTRSAATPGLVRLFLEMAVASPDHENPAHEFFTARYPRLRAMIADLFARSVEEGGQAQPAEDDAAFAARILIAASDGLQLQWLLDPSIDLRADIERLAAVLREHELGESAG